MIDLHTHSSASDGTYDPVSLVDLAADRGLSALALTDHDSIAGLEAARAEALRRGIRFVPGVEIEVVFSPGEFHLLGLDLRDAGGELRESVERLALSRDRRNVRIFELMREAGIEGDYGELREAAAGGMVGRPHIANFLLARRVVRSRQEAFDLYLAKGRPFYSAKECMELAEAVRVIREAGGLAFAAHPLSLFVSWTRLAACFREWKELGVVGIEAWHPTARPEHCRRMEKMARDHGFRVSAGSDFHGANRPDRRLGYTAGDLPIADSFLAALDR
ncbi:MAG TPA: PHP domain-containing protein [Magnetospirillaceae bacterium]|nr:PHP domain-containing protein [Magnetospirillaceae bacterium]